ncbi:hypothetical protein MW887_011401 [Aspergillus wentii]|nr:hypothetical protein MW887_011401 [Aspergillus wentii]
METQKRSVSTFYTLLDDKLAHYALLSLGCLAVLIYVWKAVFHFNAHLRRLNTFSNSDQKYFLIPNTTLARIKNHLLYAPLFHTRHNREFQLSRAINMGTLPSRLHGLVIIGILSMNITLCLVTTPYGKSEATVSKIILNRTGTMATVNLIPLVLMAGRNNPLVGLLGVPFDTWNLIHRWLGRIVVLEAVAHALADVIPRVQKSGWSYLGARFEVSLFMLSGLVACCAFVGLMVHSVSPIRHAFYETFLHLHICLVILGLAMLWVHLKAKEADALKYLVAAITLWAFERATRLIILIYRNISTKHTTADVEALPGDAVRVSLRLARPWRVKPGQHIYLYIPSIGWWSSHPFSVAWGASGEITEKIPHDVSRETKTISLLIRRRTGFTDSLFKRVSNSPDSRVRLSAFVEGPYGGTHFAGTSRVDSSVDD